MLFNPLPIVTRVSQPAQSSYIEISTFFRSLSASKPRFGGRRALHRSSFEQPSFLEKFRGRIHFPEATHEINDQISQTYRDQKSGSTANEDVVLHGYLGVKSILSKNLYFLWLHSKHLDYRIQVISFDKSEDKEPSSEIITSAHERLRSLPANTPVVIRGRFKDKVPAKSSAASSIKKIEDVEVELLDIQSLNDFPSDIIAAADTVFPPNQRHLQLRFNHDLRDALMFRAKVASTCRRVLDELQFIEVETPLLFKSTPEGAREFVVPTRQKGLAYALPQSPQQFKQILMASGIPKYYQIAKCFRDEDMRADRQPEFTQLDLEMSFVTGNDVMNHIEAIIRSLWRELLDIELPDPFPRMTYEEAMSSFGSDKPDLRLGLKPFSRIEHLLPADLISKISPLKDPIVEAMMIPLSNHYSPRKTHTFIKAFLDSPQALPFHENPDGGPGVFNYDSKRPLSGLQAFGFEAAERLEDLFDPQDGDLIILQARKNAPFSGGSTPLGTLRLALAKAAAEEQLLDPLQGFRPLWITDFPLFSPSTASEPGQGGSAGLASTHHPFTSPKSARDVDLLQTDPSKAIGDHYDLVVNGVELGGGSRRIHSAAMQEFVMREVLRMPEQRVVEFAHLLEVLRAGCPPHAGIALGFDRLVAVMLGRESVRDVIAFPKSGKGEDMLIQSPSRMSESVLQTYKLKLRE